MIRFCDKEIDCVEYSFLTRLDMLDYFLPDHKDDILCVYDSFDTMGYVGIVTYSSYQRSINVDGAIMQEYLVLGADMWQEARKYFEYYSGGVQPGILLPVLNQEYQLICFAYEDADANREIRMLRELSEMPDALQFPDIYPECQCVKMYGFNELAYFFAKYLEKQGISVEVMGMMWEGFFSGNGCQVPDYECMEIYAEGTGGKKRNWKENLLRSTSVEFECVDRIYEENIKNGVIKDSEGRCQELIERLKNEKEIIILGTGKKEQDAYDYLVGNGIDICCFADVKTDKPSNRRMFGKKVLPEKLVRGGVYKNPIFIECSEKGSAWGMGEVDYYDYIGYRRNARYILLRDYAEIPDNGLSNVLRDMEVALVGDVYLCRRLFEYLKEKEVQVLGYLNVPADNVEQCNIPECSAENVDEETICLVVEANYVMNYRHRLGGVDKEEKKAEWRRYFEENHIDNYTLYFSDMFSFIHVEAARSGKYTKKYLTPKRIILGSIEGYNGNEFFRGLLDSHPSIMMMDYNDLNNNLFWICVSLSVEPAGNILALLWKLIEGNEKLFPNVPAFNEKMEDLLSYGDEFTSQELFVMIHIAYMCMFGKNLKQCDISGMLIYWEPHYIARYRLEECVEWLGTEEVSCDIINIVRNICMQSGTKMKNILGKNPDKSMVLSRMLEYPPIDKKSYEQSAREVVKFEDLKCKPRESLMQICGQWGIPWSDSLIEVTNKGREKFVDNGERMVGGFDLEPVYNTYENFFSEFDRMRIMLINAPWQIKYGYPYVGVEQFSRRELQEMFLKEFRFEGLFDAEPFSDELGKRLKLYRKILRSLQKTRRVEISLSLFN